MHGLKIHNVYLPSDHKIDHIPRLEFLSRLTDRLKNSSRTVLAGDFNLAPSLADYHPDLDVANFQTVERSFPKNNYYCHKDTSEAVSRMLSNCGLYDPLKTSEAIVTTSRYRYRCDLLFVSEDLKSWLCPPPSYEHGVRERNERDRGPAEWRMPFTDHSAIVLDMSLP